MRVGAVDGLWSSVVLVIQAIGEREDAGWGDAGREDADVGEFQLWFGDHHSFALLEITGEELEGDKNERRNKR